MLLLVFLCLIIQSNCLVTDSIQQRTTLRAYDTNSMLLHDEFYIPITQNSDPLHSNKDVSYFMSQMQPGEYMFKSFSHSTMTATTIRSSIMLSDFQVYDICNDGTTLDYIVALYTPTNVVQVITLKASGTT